jgi:hypothetical protein
MNVRKVVLVVAGMAVLAACSLFDVNSLQQNNTPTPATIADGTRPLPPATIADGTRPLPPAMIADGTRPLPPATIADGTRPLPPVSPAMGSFFAL